MSVEGLQFRPLTLQERLTIAYEREVAKSTHPLTRFEFVKRMTLDNRLGDGAVHNDLNAMHIPLEIPVDSLMPFSTAVGMLTLDQRFELLTQQRMDSATPATNRQSIIYTAMKIGVEDAETTVWLHQMFDLEGIPRTESGETITDRLHREAAEICADATLADSGASADVKLGLGRVFNFADPPPPPDAATLKDMLAQALIDAHGCPRDAAEAWIGDYFDPPTEPEKSAVGMVPFYQIKTEEELVDEVRHRYGSTPAQARAIVEFLRYGSPQPLNAESRHLDRGSFESGLAKYNISYVHRAKSREYEQEELATHLRRTMMADENFAYFIGMLLKSALKTGGVAHTDIDRVVTETLAAQIGCDEFGHLRTQPEAST